MRQNGLLSRARFSKAYKVQGGSSREEGIDRRKLGAHFTRQPTLVCTQVG